MGTLKEYYTSLPDTDYKDDAAKLDAQITKVLSKCGDGGPGHYRVLKALKKKYGKAPETVKWSENSGSKGSSSIKTSARKGGKNGKNKNVPLQPNLHLASMDDLLEEIDRRKEKEEDEEDEGEKLRKFIPDPMDIPERLAIIGGGPAGLSAAIYAARAGLSPVIIAPLE